MANPSSSMDFLGMLRNKLEEAPPDALREVVSNTIQLLMSAEADALCGADYGERSDERVNSRNAYRPRQFDSRVGSLNSAIPKLRTGSYFPDWLLEGRRRAEAYVLGVSTRRVETFRRRAEGVFGAAKSRGGRATFAPGRRSRGAVGATDSPVASSARCASILSRSTVSRPGRRLSSLWRTGSSCRFARSRPRSGEGVLESRHPRRGWRAQ
jgi:hypothetical protein